MTGKQIMGAILILVGGYFGILGLSNDTSKFRWEEDRLIEGLPGEKAIITSFRRMLRDNPGLKAVFQTDKHGALLAMGIIGGAFGGVGVVLLASGLLVSRRSDAEDGGKDDDYVDAKSLGPIGDGEFEHDDDAIDIGILFDEADSYDLLEIGVPMGVIAKYRTLNYLVTISQGDMREDSALLIIKIYRPDLVDHLDSFSSSSMSALALQIVRAVILRHRRSEAGRSDQQFRAQDDRMRQCENEIFARRYMPTKKHRVHEKMKENLGRVFALHEQDKLQHEFRGESDEWADLSVRNISTIMSAPVSQDGAD